MKTTLDLPPELLREVKFRALEAGVKLKDAVAELLRKGLDAERQPSSKKRPEIHPHPVTGLPVIKGRHPASPLEEMTPQRIADLLLAQDVEWHLDPKQRRSSPDEEQ